MKQYSEGEGVRVLIIDDDVVSRMMLMHMIDSSGGFEVLEAEDGEDAWTQLQGGAAPAIVFCDLRMPRLSGMELLARVRADARLAGLPFVLVSAAGDAATMEQALGLGADGYIVKPFDHARVDAHLARLLVPAAAAPAAVAAASAAEHPQETARRLGIDMPRLLLYLGGLQRQLAGAATEIPQWLAAGQSGAARAQLARLREGCATLGLHGAADGLAALEAQATLDTGGAGRALEVGLNAALDAALDAVRRQAAAAGGNAH